MNFVNIKCLSKKLKLIKKRKVETVEMLPSFQRMLTKSRKKVEIALKELDIEHNTSWTRDVYNKNINNLDAIALFYRGNKITYRQLFEQAEKYAAVFEAKGVKYGDEIPMCMSNCPEFVYAIMGANLLGAKINSFGIFDLDYLTEIMDECQANFVICTDDRYSEIMNSIEKSNKKEIVMVSLADSLPNGCNPYSDIDKDFYDFKNRVSDYKKDNDKVLTIDEFLSVVDEKNVKKVTDYNVGDINTEFLVTYTSGSTNEQHPKAIVHANRSLITMGRFQEPDLSGLPPMRNLIGEMIIPNHSNTSIITSMSDVLYKKCTVAIEPIYNSNFLLYSLEINKPNYISSSRQMIVEAAKKIYNDPTFENFKMPYMMMLTSVGEPTSMGEEKFINKMMKKAQCGVAKLPVPFAPVPLSVGGGDCERGGMFFTSYRRYRDFLPQYALSNTRCGMKPYSMVETAILDQSGNELPYGQVGRLVVKTPTMMLRYKNNVEATNALYLTDSLGRQWTDCAVYSIMEKNGTIRILERIGKEVSLDDGTLIPLFYIGDLVELDTKNIMSYEVVNVDNSFVIHLELQPEQRDSKDKILLSLHSRIVKKYGEKVASKVCYRIRSFEETFPVSKCGKRSYPKLKDEGITDKCLIPIYKENEIIFEPFSIDKQVKVYQKK